jgi:hypothetical protein
MTVHELIAALEAAVAMGAGDFKVSTWLRGVEDVVVHEGVDILDACVLLLPSKTATLPPGVRRAE